MIFQRCMPPLYAIILLAAHPATAQTKPPEVWMALLPADVLIADTTPWRFVLENVDGVKFWTQQVDLPAEQWPFQGGVPSPDAFGKLIRILTENKVDLAIEKGLWPQKTPDPSYELMGGKPGPYDATFAQRAADNEIDRLNRVKAMGGTIRFLDVDGPIRHMLYPAMGGSGFANISEAADTFTAYMGLVRKTHPETEFFALTNFPNWGYKGEVAYWGEMFWGDYFEAIKTLIEKAKPANVGLRGVTVDNPYDYIIGETPDNSKTFDSKSINWVERVLDLERYVRSQGLEYNLIINSQRGGEASAELFCKETLAFLDLYHAKGGRPDRYIVQSWYTHPDRTEIIPETQPNTFMWLVKEVILKTRALKP